MTTVSVFEYVSRPLGPIPTHSLLYILMSPRSKWLRSLKIDKIWGAFTQAQDGAQATGDHKSAQIQSALSVACVGGRVAAALKASCRSAGVREANGKGFLPHAIITWTNSIGGSGGTFRAVGSGMPSAIAFLGLGLLGRGGGGRCQ